MKEKKRLLSLVGLTENAQQFYKVKFNRWLFENSDNVWIDGELISKNEKIAIQAAFFNIKPEPKTMEVDGLSKGRPLSEKIFIKNELHNYNNVNEQEYIIPDQLKLIDYISFLENRLSSIDKVRIKEKTLKSQQTFALYCHYAGINPNDYSFEELSNLLQQHGVAPSKNKSKRPYHKLKQYYNYYLRPIDRYGCDKEKKSGETLKRFTTIIEYCETKGITDCLPKLKDEKDLLEQNIINSKE